MVEHHQLLHHSLVIAEVSEGLLLLADAYLRRLYLII